MSKQPRRQSPEPGDVEKMQCGPKLVSISLMLPYSGVDHAGGELLLHHYRVLAERCDSVAAFAVDFDENLRAANRDADIASDSYSAVIVKLPRWRRSLLGKIVARIWHFALPVLPDIGIWAAFASSKALRESLLEADIVELQWFEYFFFRGLVHRINSRAEVIGFAHDIPSQKFERAFSHWPAGLLRTYIAYARWLERMLLRGIPTVTVLSSKDASLIAKRSTSVRAVVLDPPLDLGHPASAVNADSLSDDACTSFGFVAAFQRPENHDAAMWLLSEIWPFVLEDCPAGRLYLVGSRPSQELQDAATAFGDAVTVTGYVDDIDSFNDQFSTVVIPLRYGAGVKFKTVSAILAGKNIVATPIAVEGTISHQLFFAVSDSAEVLAKAMIELATYPNKGRELSEQARAEVGSRYSIESYTRTVATAYRLDDWPKASNAPGPRRCRN